LPPVQLFVVVDVPDEITEARVVHEMARGMVEDAKPARARHTAVQWLGGVLPPITPRGVRLEVVGPVAAGPALLGLKDRSTAARGRIVIITLALQDDSTSPGNAAPAWLVMGLLRAGGRGTRALSVSRAGALYVWGKTR
jgi:hypothetical protein